MNTVKTGSKMELFLYSTIQGIILSGFSSPKSHIVIKTEPVDASLQTEGNKKLDEHPLIINCSIFMF